jgi:hypothetical protein
MSVCERCWQDSYYHAPDTTQVGEYRRLLEVRTCSPEQQAGRRASRCLSCDRQAVHEITGECMACGRWPGDLGPSGSAVAGMAAHQREDG